MNLNDLSKQDLIYILEPLVNKTFGWSEEISKRLEEILDKYESKTSS